MTTNTPSEQPAIPEGMVAWAGGDSAPSDWDGGPVLYRNGAIDRTWDQPTRWVHAASSHLSLRNSTTWMNAASDIIAYTPKPAIPDIEGMLDWIYNPVWAQPHGDHFDGNWVPDCQGKIDYDPGLLRLSCRVYSDGTYICSAYFGADTEIETTGVLHAATKAEARLAVEEWCRGQARSYAARLLAPIDQPAQAGEVERLRDLLDTERYKVAAGVQAIARAVQGRKWLSEPGRGSYTYDDERYQAEFGAALDEIYAALKPLQAIAQDWSDCPRDPIRVAANRNAALNPSQERAETGV